MRRLQELSVEAIEGVVEAIACGVGHDLAILAAHLRVDEDVRADFIIVHRVVGRVLMMPLDLAGRGIDRQRAVGIEVVARPIR